MPDTHDSPSDTGYFRGADGQIRGHVEYQTRLSETVIILPADNGIINQATLTAEEYGRTLDRVLAEWQYFDPQNTESPLHVDFIQGEVKNPDDLILSGQSYELKRSIYEKILATLQAPINS